MHHFKLQLQGLEGFRHVALESLPMGCGCDGYLGDWLAEALLEQHDLDVAEYPITLTRKLKRQAQVGVVTFRLVRQWRNYGGPEEGGWYYTEEELLREWTVPSRNARRHKERLERYAEAQNELIRGGGCEGKYAVFTGAWKARRRPHYC